MPTDLSVQILEAKTKASALATKVAEAEAELRAIQGRLEDANAKATTAQESEESLQEVVSASISNASSCRMPLG